jgi:hypothetical protein
MSPRVLASIVAMATWRVFTIVGTRMGSMNAIDRARVIWCVATLICALMVRIGGRLSRGRGSRRLQATTGIKSLMVAACDQSSITTGTKVEYSPIVESPFTG